MTAASLEAQSRIDHELKALHESLRKPINTPYAHFFHEHQLHSPDAGETTINDPQVAAATWRGAGLPDEIVADLGINFVTLGRSVASYTPYHRDGRDDGLLVSTEWDESNADGFNRLTGSDKEGIAWRGFYGEIAELTRRFAPGMLQPLKSEAELKAVAGLPEVWRNLMEIPIGEVIRTRFTDDLVQGVADLTDASIGTHVSADDMLANRCFLHHLIRNGNGQWRVPQGGMGALANKVRSS